MYETVARDVLRTVTGTAGQTEYLEEVMMAARASWTVLVFMNADNNLEEFGLKDFAEMAQVGSTPDVNIVVQIDRAAGYYTTSPDWTGALRFRVERDMKPSPDRALEDLGEVNMGDGGVLADFVSWGMRAFPADRFLLDIWDHGQGWRVFQTEALSSKDLAIEHRTFRRRNITRLSAMRAKADSQVDRAVPAIPLQRVVNGPVRYISHDESSNDFLFNREVQDALERVLEGRSLDVIGFDACLMATVETAYAMRNVGRFMVGSEELEPGDGWNYADWLRTLTSRPQMDGAELSRVMVDSYAATYASHSPDTTLSAVNLGAASTLAERISTLSRKLIDSLPEESAAIALARKRCDEYAPGYGLHGIDLARFCTELAAATSDPQVRTLTTAVQAEVTTMVVRNYAGAARRDTFGSHGLTIYFPETIKLFQVDPDHEGYVKANKHFPVQFVQDHLWADFLQAYYVCQDTLRSPRTISPSFA
jgi:hypothetical protein